jgi:hypothetical protein
MIHTIHIIEEVDVEGHGHDQELGQGQGQGLVHEVELG